MEESLNVCHVFADLIELLKKLLEPSVALRLPLLDCETHPWLTCGQKLPFVPFSSLPKDKTAKTQVGKNVCHFTKGKNVKVCGLDQTGRICRKQIKCC